MSKTLLIDGDVLTYQIGYSVETPIYVVKGAVYKTAKIAKKMAVQKGLDPKLDVFKRPNIGSFDQVKVNLSTKLKQIFEDTCTRNYQMFLTEPGIENNFRTPIATIQPYKGNREKSGKPHYYDQIRELLKDGYKAIMADKGEEADDAIAKAQYSAYKAKGHFDSTIASTIDKDADTYEGWHFNWDRRILYFIDNETANKNYYRQLLTGDTCDHIPGITKILKIQDREEEANKIIYSHYIASFDTFAIDHSSAECYDYIEKMYREYSLLNELEEIKQLLWIKRE